jgi:hypothetical protein
MTDQTVEPLSGEDYNRIASGASISVHMAMRGMHMANVEKFDNERINGAPIIQGTCGGLLSFCMIDGEMTFERAKEIIIDSLNAAGPQIEFFMASDKAGGGKVGIA